MKRSAQRDESQPWFCGRPVGYAADMPAVAARWTVGLSLSLLASAGTLSACSATHGASDAGGGPPDVPAPADTPVLDAPPLDAPGPDGFTVDAPVLADAPPADAQAADVGTEPLDAPPCSGCASVGLTWGQDGGLACTRDSSSFASCRAFTHRRVAEGCDPIDRMCTNDVPACDTSGADAIVLADIEAALEHPDVVAALAAAPVLYGTDPRAFDGTVFYVTVGSARIEVGPCAVASCSDVPAGVRALQMLLEGLTGQELVRGECASVFPTG